MESKPTETRVSRRRFVDWLLIGSVGALVASIFYPVLRYLTPPHLAEANVSMVEAAKTSELKRNSGKTFRFGPDPGIVIETPGGEIRAFSAVCTHLGCTVQYREDLQQIWCACHDGHYDLLGRNIAGPPPRPLPRYKVNIQGEDIFVSKDKV